MQLQIIKDALLSQLKHTTSQLFPTNTNQDEHETSMVFTSTCTGLIAAKEIKQKNNFPFVSLFPEELNNFLQHFSERIHRDHVHIWSYFLEELDEETIRIARRYPLNENERYWLHVEGIMYGQRLGRGIENLWCWDGSQTRLLKKSFLHWTI
jgi:hypothetical protein